jgi:hypothetical protein
MEPEPNNKFIPENCAAANFTQFFGGVWGWADTNCYDNYPFICKIPREPRPGCAACLRPCKTSWSGVAGPSHMLLTALPRPVSSHSAPGVHVRV